MMAERQYEPMLLTERSVLPAGPDWGYEAKLDGYRMIADVQPDGATLISRGGNNFTDRFRNVASELPIALNGLAAVLDGEMVGHNEAGQQSFSALRRLNSRAVYYVFDLLEVAGEPITAQPLRDRRARLQELLTPTVHVRTNEMFYDRDAMLAAAKEHHLEGVVAKRLNSPYRPGIRSRNWLKLILIRHPEGFARE